MSYDGKTWPNVREVQAKLNDPRFCADDSVTVTKRHLLVYNSYEIAEFYEQLKKNPFVKINSTKRDAKYNFKKLAGNVVEVDTKYCPETGDKVVTKMVGGHATYFVGFDKKSGCPVHFEPVGFKFGGKQVKIYP